MPVITLPELLESWGSLWAPNPSVESQDGSLHFYLS